MGSTPGAMGKHGLIGTHHSRSLLLVGKLGLKWVEKKNKILEVGHFYLIIWLMNVENVPC